MTLELKAMEMKKSERQLPTAAKGTARRSFQIFEAIGNIKEEFSKISWTTTDELRVYTKIVVATTFLLGLTIYFIDLTIQGCLELLGTSFHYIFG